MKDRLGFEVGRRHDEQGRPLKITSRPPSQAYAEGWERTFGKKSKKPTEQAEESWPTRR